MKLKAIRTDYTAWVEGKLHVICGKYYIEALIGYACGDRKPEFEAKLVEVDRWTLKKAN